RRLVAELGLDDAVDFMGEQGDLATILRALDVVLLPSWEEPFGVAVIEAMAMEVPVLATCVGGPAEIVRCGQDGVTLPPRQPERWAQVLDDLLSRPGLRAEMGRSGRRRVLEVFNPQSYLDGVLRVYRDVAGPERDERNRVGRVTGAQAPVRTHPAAGPRTGRPGPI